MKYTNCTNRNHGEDESIIAKFFKRFVLIVAAIAAICTSVKAQVDLTANINQSNQGSNPTNLSHQNGRTTFFAESEAGRQLYVIDEEEGTPQALLPILGRNQEVTNSIQYEDDLYYSTVSPNGSRRTLRVFRVDFETNERTQLIERESGSQAHELTAVVEFNDQTVLAIGSDGARFYTTDGTQEGTEV